ncbi:hypothetical protein A5881_003901 [Enterococcus termitis]|nr:hypothetical protein A5881_003921 [Enterococcus termitis]
MPTAIMTPEEVLKYGQRVVVFARDKNRNKQRETYFIENQRLVKKSKLWVDGQAQAVTYIDQSQDIEDLYPFIERVYSRQTKGVLIARRSGNYESNQRRPLPLRKTGKGMGGTLQGAQLANATYLLLCDDNQPELVKKRAKQRIEKRKQEEEKKNKLQA